MLVFRQLLSHFDSHGLKRLLISFRDQSNVRFTPKADNCALFVHLSGVQQDRGRQLDAERRVFSASCANHIPLMFIATGEKARISRLATIFAVVAWYFLKRSVANWASTAAALSQTSNSRTWFGSFCETTILNWRQPSSFTAAAPR